MEVLFISTSIPPCMDMQTTRNMYLINSLLNRGYQIDILTCGEYYEGQSSFDSILNRTTIIRTNLPNLYRWHFLAQKIFNHTPLLKIHNVLINYYAKPDLYANWDKLAYKEITKNEMKKYDIIISSSGSYTAHVLGAMLKKKFGIKWVADYGDPWGINAYGEINKKYYKNEQQILKYSDGLIFTTQPTIDAYNHYYDNQIRHCLVQCGYEKIIEDNECTHNDSMTFVYTGIAYSRSRNLSVILDVISSNVDIKFKIVGTYSQSLKNGMKGHKNIIFKGRVTYAKSLEILSRADVLVHIGNFGTMQVPGKTYIYLSSKKPILYIQQEKNNDPTLNILSEFGGIILCVNTKESIEMAIRYIMDNYKDLKNQSEKRALSHEIEKYRWDNLGDKFCGFIDSCIENQ